MDEERLEALWVEPSPAEERRLLGGSSEVEPGDDPEDADPVQATARSQRCGSRS
jgi:hypothetical protein